MVRRVGPGVWKHRDWILSPVEGVKPEYRHFWTVRTWPVLSSGVLGTSQEPLCRSLSVWEHLGEAGIDPGVLGPLSLCDGACCLCVSGPQTLARLSQLREPGWLLNDAGDTG